MKIELTQEQIADRGQHLAQLIDRLTAERQSKQNDTADHNETIKALEKQIKDLALVVRTGVEFVDDDVLPFETSSAKAVS